MSSTVGYHLSATDTEAERRRELRGDLVSALARLTALRAPARGIGPSIPDHTGIVELQDLLARVTTALAETEESISAAWRERWRAELGTVVPGLSAGDAAVRGAVTDAESLIADAGRRCDGEAVAAALDVYEELVKATSVARARALSLEIAVIVGRSLARYRAVRAAEDSRVRLLELVRDTAATDQEVLRDFITTVTDLDVMASHVHNAVRREDIARHRRDAAAAVAQALPELGCAVGAGFERSLLIDGYAVAGFCAHDGYGLRVSLPLDGAVLLTTVVSTDEREGSAQVEATYHAETLPKLHAKLCERGVRLDGTPLLVDDLGRLVPATGPGV